MPQLHELSEDVESTGEDYVIWYSFAIKLFFSPHLYIQLFYDHSLIWKGISSELRQRYPQEEQEDKVEEEDGVESRSGVEKDTISGKSTGRFYSSQRNQE